MANHLYFGDNLGILRESIASESVDLIYLDPPFNSKASYNVLFKSPAGHQSEAQLEAFEDTWHWTDDAEVAYDEVMQSGNPDAAEMLRAMRSFLKENDMMAYLTMMAVRILELHRVLRSTGSLYLHCDPTASHYLKLLLDAVFGPDKFRTEIIWKRSSAHSDAKQGRRQHGRIHDVLLFYTKSDEWTWNQLYTEYDQSYVEAFYKHIEKGTGRRYRMGDLTAAKPGGDTKYEWRIKRPQGGDWTADLDEEWKAPKEGCEYKGVVPYSKRIWAYSKANMVEMARNGRIVYAKTGMPNYKRYLDEMPGVALQDLWTDVGPVSAQGKERLGYPTQKPLTLLDRIVESSSNEGDVVMDPFCGCGTAIHSAERLKRQWIGIDVTHLAISLIESRLKDAFPNIQYEVHGTPTTVSGAENLAKRHKHQFEWWALSLVSATPFTGKKMGADSGIDGVIYFKVSGGKTEKAIVSVKGGKNVGVSMVRDLKGVIERERAAIGVFITLAEPTRPMLKEAASAGLYDSGFRKHARIQIKTIAELMDGNLPDILMVDPQNLRRADREHGRDKQVTLKF